MNKGEKKSIQFALTFPFHIKQKITIQDKSNELWNKDRWLGLII